MIFLLLALVLPNKTITPGSVDTTITKEQVCIPGWSGKHRDVSIAEKKEVFKRYNIDWKLHSNYEVDHLVSLELGGTNDITNLWPEAYEPRPGAHEKDKVENYLHSQVCKNKMSLEDAQNAIKNDWLSIYRKIYAR